MPLDDYIAELSDLDDQEKLEVLVELAEELPPLSPHHGTAPFPTNCRVQECQTAVHLWVEVKDGRVHLEADVPRNSPTVRGLVSIVVNSLQDQTAEQVISLPEDLLPLLGLQSALGMTRQRGLRGVMHRIQSEVRRQMATENS